MNAKKLLSLVFSAAFAVAALAGCGGSDFSREAARAANKAQDTVTFETDANLTKALQKALEDNAGDIRQAVADALGDELGSGDAVDLYTVSAEDAKTAAEAVAASIAKSVAGKQSKGAITMVKADDGAVYAITITTRTGSSGGSGSGSGSGDDGNTGTTVNCTITIVGSEHGSVTTTDGKTTVEKGTSVTFNVNPDNTYDLSKLTVNGDDKTSQVENNQITLIIDSDTKIEATFVKSKMKSWIVTGILNVTTYNVGAEFDPDDLYIQITYENDNIEKIHLKGQEKNYIVGWPVKMDASVKAICVKYNDESKAFTLNTITINPTESEYGESKYLTEEDMEEIKEVFEKTVASKGYVIGTNEAIINRLATNGKLEYTDYSFLMSLGYSGRVQSVDTVCGNVGELKGWIESSIDFVAMPGAPTTEIYMTIKDTADGKIECHIYAVCK